MHTFYRMPLLKFGDMWGDGDLPKAHLLQWPASILKQVCHFASLARSPAYPRFAHNQAQRVLVLLSKVAVLGDIHTNIGLWECQVRPLPRRHLA